MAEQHAHGRHPPFRLSLSPVESDPIALPGSTADPSTTNYDIDIGADDPDLPPLGFNIRRPQVSQEHMSPDQRLSPMDSDRPLAPPLGHQVFGAVPTPLSAYMQQRARQAQPHSYQSKHTNASTDRAAPLASSSPNRSEYHSSYHHAEPKMQMHAPEVVHDDQTSSHGPPAQRAGAQTIAHLPNAELSSSENDGLIFNSYAHSVAERQKVFGRTVTCTEDDVEEVDQHKDEYVLAILKALERKDYLPPPEGRNATKKEECDDTMIKTSEADKAKWVKWQKQGQDDFEAHLKMIEREAGPDWSETVHRAWEVFNEIMKIHRQGFQLVKENAKQVEDKTLKCSERLEEAVRVLKEYARIRAKVIKGQNILEFCVSPESYVRVTIAASKNNSGRPFRNNTVREAGPSQEVAKKDESVARGSGKGRKKKQSAATKGDGPAGAGDIVEQEPTSAVSSDIRANGSSPGDAQGRGESEDAEWQNAGNAIAGQVSNNSVSTFNTSGLGNEPFVYAPGHSSLRRSPRDGNPYGNNFGNYPNTMYASYRPIQAEPHDLGSSEAFGLPAQRYPMLAPMSFGSGFISSTLPGAGYQQHNVYPIHGLPIVPSSAAGCTANYNMTGNPSAGLSNSQGPQNDARETHTRKRRKYGQ